MLSQIQKKLYKAKYYQEHKEIAKKYSAEYYRKHREVLKKASLKYQQTHRETRNKTQMQRYRDAKMTVLAHYGNKCACCEETNPMFLTIDHINGDGAHDRNVNKRTNIAFWLIKNKFPEGFQTLCYNCNCGRQYNYKNPGICPHKE